MTRITPRTCLWPITFTLIGTFLLSIGLTFRSDHHCYAATCGEWLFPLQARLHVVIWYLWISISVVVLAIRAFHPSLRHVLRRPLANRKLPVIGKHFALSGALIIIWICVLYGAVVGIWWVRLSTYFVGRGNDNGVFSGGHRLAAIALTGHMCDITMGMVLLPISRHSALASFFKLSVSTTLAFHMLLAYVLFFLVLTHGFLYVSWIPVFNSLSAGLKQVFPVLNPTYLYNETWPGNTDSLGIWRASLPFSGLFTTVIMILIFITTLPAIRRNHFNLFYFTHLTVILGVIIICLHASTMFYCTAPGLVLWIVDWAMRVYELKKEVAGSVTSYGNGYYVLSMQMPRNRLDGCACHSPLAHFYIYHSDSSIRELHPFTTITHLASENTKTPKNEDSLRIQFLFRKRSNSIVPSDIKTLTKTGFWATTRTLMSPKAKATVQWTEKLASLADTKEKPSTNESSINTSPALTPTVTAHQEMDYSGTDITLRLEGPYFTPADPARYKTVVCLVAGTGLSGAIAVAGAFVEMERQRSASENCGPIGGACMANAVRGVWERCVVIWSCRESDFVDLPFLKVNPASSLEVRTQFTGPGKPRMDFAKTIEEIKSTSPPGPIWVYLSGPTPYITTGEKACKQAGVDYYGARWDI